MQLKKPVCQDFISPGFLSNTPVRLFMITSALYASRQQKPFSKIPLLLFPILRMPADIPAYPLLTGASEDSKNALLRNTAVSTVTAYNLPFTHNCALFLCCPKRNPFYKIFLHKRIHHKDRYRCDNGYCRTDRSWRDGICHLLSVPKYAGIIPP